MIDICVDPSSQESRFYGEGRCSVQTGQRAGETEVREANSRECWLPVVGGQQEPHFLQVSAGGLNRIAVSGQSAQDGERSLFGGAG